MEGTKITLIRSMLTPFGIVMAADTTLTVKYPYPTENDIIRHYTDAKKLQEIPHLSAGISWWGEGTIDGMNADAWLENFIRCNHSTNLEDFANSLRDRLRALRLEVRDDRDLRFGTIGFHLAGFVDFEDRRVPILYHIHNGQSETQTGINPRIVNANLDWNPEKVLECWEQGHYGGLRNGDFKPYAILSHYLSGFFRHLENELTIEGVPFQIPYPRNLSAYAEYLRFEIKLVSKIYALSNHPPIIGGKVITLTIADNNECEYKIE